MGDAIRREAKAAAAPSGGRWLSAESPQRAATAFAVAASSIARIAIRGAGATQAALRNAAGARLARVSPEPRFRTVQFPGGKQNSLAPRIFPFREFNGGKRNSTARAPLHLVITLSSTLCPACADEPCFLAGAAARQALQCLPSHERQLRPRGARLVCPLHSLSRLTPNS